MRKILIYVLFVVFSVPVYAGPNSVLGGKPLVSPTAHYVALGWPSLAYEWWHSGNPDWAIGGELVYGDWSGQFSNVDVGFALNVPFRWHLHHDENLDVAFKLAPGVLIGSVDGPGNDRFVGGIRAEFGVPITIVANNRINIITGATVPFTVMFVEGGSDRVIIPILPRIGVEFEATENITPFFFIEAGPTLAIGDSNTDVELGVRAWAGAIFF